MENNHTNNNSIPNDNSVPNDNSISVPNDNSITHLNNFAKFIREEYGLSGDPKSWVNDTSVVLAGAIKMYQAIVKDSENNKGEYSFIGLNFNKNRLNILDEAKDIIDDLYTELDENRIKESR